MGEMLKEFDTGKAVPVMEYRGPAPVQTEIGTGQIRSEEFVLAVARDGNLFVWIGGRKFFIRAHDLVGVAYAALQKRRMQS